MSTVARSSTRCQICDKPIRAQPLEVFATGFTGGRDVNRPFILWLCRDHKADFYAFLSGKPAPGPRVVVLRDAPVPRLSANDVEALRAVGAWAVIDRANR